MLPAVVDRANSGRCIEREQRLEVVRQGVLVVEHRIAECAVLANRDVLAKQQPQDFCGELLLGTLSDDLKDLVEIDIVGLGEIGKTHHRAALGLLELGEEVLDGIDEGREATAKGQAEARIACHGRSSEAGPEGSPRPRRAPRVARLGSGTPRPR